MSSLHTVGTYSIDDSNAKINVAVLRQRQDWKGTQIEDVKLFIQENYTFIIYNIFFIVLSIFGNSLKEFNKESSLIFSDTY